MDVIVPRQAWLLAKNDLRQELRDLELVLTAAFFTLSVLVMFALAFATLPAADHVMAVPGMLWIGVAFVGDHDLVWRADDAHRVHRPDVFRRRHLPAITIDLDVEVLDGEIRDLAAGIVVERRHVDGDELDAGAKDRLLRGGILGLGFRLLTADPGNRYQCKAYAEYSSAHPRILNLQDPSPKTQDP